MKDLWDVRAYAREKGMSERNIERLMDEIETDGNGNVTDECFDEICFSIDCEMEGNDYV